jgi:UDP-N-acetylmuramoylalanine--D-glutamate ligase
VSNADDTASEGLLAGVPGRHLHFSVRAVADAWYDRDSDLLRIREEALLPRRELVLLGDHNVANALAAALAVHAIGVPLDRIAEGLRSFTALQHRMEPVRELDGVLWINDSKATNLAATEVALAALTRPCLLLLGGRHKGEPYSRLAPLLLARCRAVIAYGEATPIIVSDLSSAGLVPLVAGSFESVMSEARSRAQPGDAVLLSPACSSYDMFSNYEERGRRFREIVEAW